MIEAMSSTDLLGLLAQTAGGADTGGGNYFSTPKILVMLVLVFPWLYLAPKVSKDALSVRISPQMWSGVVLGAGAVGFLIWLLIPIYLVGMLVYLVAVTTAYLTYVSHRNGRVPADQRLDLGQQFAKMFKRREPPPPPVMPVTRVKLYDSNGKIVPPPGAMNSVQEIELYNLTQEFLYEMLWRRASEVDMLPVGNQTRVTYVIDGMAAEGRPVNLMDSEAMIQHLKVPAGINLEERRRPQRGIIGVDLASGPTEIVITTAGTNNGQRMQFKIRQEIIQTRLTELGMGDDVLASVRKNSEVPGLIIVSGRPGSGITSTLYSLLRDHDAYTKQIVTFEKVPAVELENITQSKYESVDDLPLALASALRRDPDVIMLDACDSTPLAQQIADAAGEKIFLIGMPASDTFMALAKWIKTAGDTQLALKTLRGVLCQMLIRKVCPTCREAYKPDRNMLAKANLQNREVEVMYRTPTRPRVDEEGTPIICQTCQGLGYFGRTAAFEWLEITDELRKLVAQNAPAANIKAACRKNRMLYLQEQALEKVLEGVTSIQEVIRVSTQAKAKKEETRS